MNRDLEMFYISSLPSDKILKSFWSLCAYYKRHVNDGLCDIVFDAICLYSRAYMDRTGCPILVFEECSKLISLLKNEGLQ